MVIKMKKSSSFLNTVRRFLQPVAGSLSLALALAGTALLPNSVAVAEDIEIYTTSSEIASGVKPNLVFIFDTSGSMSGQVTVNTGTYDPTQTYSGSCNSGRVYYSSTGAPSCSTSRWFNASANRCNASETALSTGEGFYLTRVARYRSRSRGDRWSSLSTNDRSSLVECKDDWGVHGESDGSANLYPADERRGGPWRANSSRAINWDRVGSTYTLYSANYLNWRESNGGSTTMTRLEIVQDVFGNLIDGIQDINIAVMRYDNRYSGNSGGYFIMPMQELTAANRADYKNAVNALTPSGYTPLSETLYESYLFYKGDNVRFGNSTSPGTNHAGVLDPSNSSRYKTPVEYQCQKNFVILLTDGAPVYDTGADSYIENLPGFSTITGGASCSGNCLDELADYMYTKDCSSLDDTQNVITYTIGFHTDQSLLSAAASKGGGKYYTADDTAGLTDVFTEILTEILAINTTFIAPAVTVNSFNRFNHRNELYFALFRPDARPRWDGNVKRFGLAGDPPEIVDANGVEAVDTNTGFFKPTVTSVWTQSADAPDGDDVGKGGAASRLTLPRNVYTYTGSGDPSNVTLTAAEHALTETNSAITKTMLGDASMTDQMRTDILQWARGVDLFDDDSDGLEDDIRRIYGSPLHAKPALITYGGTDANPDITLFVSTNEGYLHAIDTSDGTEQFSFVPQELLSNLPIVFDDVAGTDYPYGLDGGLTAWVNDLNGNRLLYTNGSLDSGEFVYLYQGMRRGGKNYYALNVTNRNSPKLKWMIKGGIGDFSELGQTWSSMTKAKIKLNNVEKDVLIFGGGYDVDQDDNETAQNDDEGRAVYIVDANTGAKLWQAGPAGSGNATGGNPSLVLSGMTNSIPSDVTVIDMDLDGFHDRLYVGDMRGQIWRFDLDNDDNTGASNLATGGKIAELGGTTAADNRRFYYQPDVSLSKNKKHLNIAIGSGYRAHPLDKDIHDRFFVIRDENVKEPATDANGNAEYTVIDIDDLYDTTDNLIGEGTDAQISVAESDLDASQGFYIDLDVQADGTWAGEKVLAKSVTSDFKIAFTTFTPVGLVSGACSQSQGAAALYLINVEDGTPVEDFDQSGGPLTRSDRKKDLVRGGIAPEVSLIFTDDGAIGLCGTENCLDNDKQLVPEKTYWYIQ